MRPAPTALNNAVMVYIRRSSLWWMFIALFAALPANGAEERAAATAEVSALESRLDELTAERQRAMETVRRAERQLWEAGARAEVTQPEVLRLREELRELRRRMRRLENELQELVSALPAFRDAAERREKAMARVRELDEERMRLLKTLVEREGSGFSGGGD